MAPGTPRHGAAASSIPRSIENGPSGVTVGGREMAQSEVEAALRRVRAGHDARVVVDTSRRASAENGTGAHVRAVLTNLAEACGGGKLTMEQMSRVQELVAVFKGEVRS